jgi:hypothetical protein
VGSRWLFIPLSSALQELGRKQKEVIEVIKTPQEVHTGSQSPEGKAKTIQEVRTH